MQASEPTAPLPPVDEDESPRREPERSLHEQAALAEYQQVEEGSGERHRARIAEDVMTRRPFVLPTHAPLSEARALFRRHGFRHVPVVGADGAIAGLLSERDLLRRDADPSASGAATVADLAAAEVLTATPDTSLREIAATMLERRVGSLPVVDAQHRPVGIITRADILRAVVQRAPLELWA